MDAQDPIQPNTDKTTADMPAPMLPSTGEAGHSTSGMHTDKNKNWLNWVLLGAVFVSLVALLVNIDRSLFVAPQADSVDAEATLSLELQGDGQVAQGDQIQVLVKMQNGNTNQLTYGADIVLNYNEDILEYVSAEVPAGVPNGCTSENPTEAAVVLAPVTNAQADGCAFNNTNVKSQADQTGQLRFGAVSFNWSNSETEGYTPVPFPANTSQSLALVTFKVKSNAVSGATEISFDFEANQTDDSNVGVIQNEVVGDALANVNTATATVEDPTGTECPATNLSGDAQCVIDNDDFQLWVRAYRCSIDVGEAYNIDCDQPGGTDFPSFEVSDADFNGVDGVDFDDLNFIKQALN